MTHRFIKRAADAVINAPMVAGNNGDFVPEAKVIARKILSERPTPDVIEAAAKAIFTTWAKFSGSTMTWEEAVLSTKSPKDYPKMSGIVPLCRLEGEAAAKATLEALCAELEAEG